MLADLAVQLIIYQFKRGFLWGIYRKKGLGLLWAKSKRNKQILWTEKGIHCPLLSVHRDGQKCQTDTIFRPQGRKITSTIGHRATENSPENSSVQGLPDIKQHDL